MKLRKGGGSLMSQYLDTFVGTKTLKVRFPLRWRLLSTRLLLGIIATPRVFFPLLFFNGAMA